MRSIPAVTLIIIIIPIYSIVLFIFRLRFAFDLATRNLHIDALLDPEDVNTNKPDKKSILMYVMCLYQAIESMKTSRLSNAPSIQMLDQHFGDSSENIHSPSTSSVPSQFSEANVQMHQKQASQQSQVSHVGNLTDLDDISLAKSIENLSEFPVPTVQRSSTFTITKNELNNLVGGDNNENSTNLNHETGCGSSTGAFQTFIESRSRPMSTATNISVEIGGYQNAIEIVLSLLLEAEETLSKQMPEITELSEAKAQFQSHEEFMIKLSEYQEYVGGALEEGARLLSEPITNTGLMAEDQAEIKQQMLLLNERWEMLRISALEVQSRVHSKLAQIQMDKIEELRDRLTATEDQISRMPDIDSSPDAIPQQIIEHKSLEASLNEQKALVDDLSNLVVIVNDDSFNDLEDKLAALGERWTHVVKWTKNRFQKLQDAHWHWKLLNKRFDITNKWINVRENDLKQMESRDLSAIANVMERMENLRFCALDINVLYESLLRLEEIAQSLKPASCHLLDKLESLVDRCEALKEIIEVQKQRIEGMGFDFNVDSPNNVKLPIGWNDFKLKFNTDYRASPEVVDSDAQSDSENSPQMNKKRKLQKSMKRQQLDSQIQDMTDFVANGEKILLELNNISGLDLQRKSLEQLQNNLKQRITEYAEVKTLLSECVEADGVDLTEESNEISNIGTKYDELSFRVEHLIGLNDKALIKQKFVRNLTGLKLVLADCQDWFKQYANLNVSTQGELENRLTYMESMRSEIDDAMEFYRNADDKDDLKEWKIDFDQFYDSWTSIKSAIKRLIDDNFGMEPMDDDDLTETVKSAEFKRLQTIYNEAKDSQVIVSSLDEMNNNLRKLNSLNATIVGIECNAEVLKNSDEIEKWQKLNSSFGEKISKQIIAIQNLNHFTTESDQVISLLSKLEETLQLDVFILGEQDDLEAQIEAYETKGMEIKKIEIDLISVKNFSEVIIRDSTNDEHKADLLAKVQSINDLYSRVKKMFQTKSKELKLDVEQTENIFKSIKQTELWLNDLEKLTPTTENSEIKTSNELFQIRNKFQALKDTCEQKTTDFRELNEMGSEMLLRIDDQLNQPNCQRKYSTLAKQFTKLNAKWNEVTALIYNRTALLEHISSQLGELKTLIVSESGYLDKLEKCLRKSPENAADAEEIYEELDVSVQQMNAGH